MIHNLRQLLASPAEVYSDDHIFAYNPEGAVTWAQFWVQVNIWQQLLSHIDEPEVALYESDSLEFLAALLALWRLGKRALIPANNLPLTCQQLSRTTTIFVGDFPLDQTITRSGTLTDIAQFSDKRLTPEPSAPALVLFTSGSTGDPEPVVKRFEQLEAELTALENLWGAQLGSAAITGSVSHQHIYGLLFRLLWPVCSGRPFVTHACDYWEELVINANLYKPAVIISSPAHLDRIPQLNWPALPLAVFSSGARLTTEAALLANQALGVSVIEVYGSTETGGIAWREQSRNSTWTCLPGVAVRCEERLNLLEVQSAHLMQPGWFTTADRVTMNPDGNFTLCGRADRIAKVAGKRISLSAVEQALEQHPWVQQARVLLLPERGDRLGAALVLTHEASRYLIDQGKNTLNQQLKAALAHAVDRVAMPRYWRYLTELPRNQQGKTTFAELQPLFSQEQPRLPEIISCEKSSASSLVFKLFIPANLYYFEGHFSGHPVLPGVAQTHWAIHYAREHWGSLGEFSGLEVLKFQQVITANKFLDLHITYEPGTNEKPTRIYFNYVSGLAPDKQVAHSSGRILFTEGTH